MKISKIEVKNFLSLKFCCLKFNTSFNTVIFGGTVNEIKWEIMQAISLIIDPKYEDITEVAKLIGNPKSGYVKLNLMVKIKDKYEQLIALRYFGYAEYILYSFRGKYSEVLSADFHQKFNLHGSLLCDEKINESRSLIDLPTLKLYSKEPLLNKVLEKYDKIKLLNEKSSECLDQEPLLESMVQVLLEIYPIFDHKEKTENFFIFNKIAKLFNYLTSGRHQVAFYIPCCQQNEQLSISDLYLNDLTVHIVYENGNELLWYLATDLLKELLQISVKLVMASIHNTKVIFLNNLSEIKYSQHFDLMIHNLKEMSDKDETTMRTPKGNCLNYLQKIIDFCNRKDMMVFINVNIINYQALHSTNTVHVNDNRILSSNVNISDISKKQYCQDFNEFIGDGSEPINREVPLNLNETDVSNYANRRTTNYRTDLQKRNNEPQLETVCESNENAVQTEPMPIDRIPSLERKNPEKIQIISNILLSPSQHFQHSQNYFSEQSSD